MQTGYVASQHAFIHLGLEKEPIGSKRSQINSMGIKSHFEAVAQWNNWTYEEKGLQLGTCLRGKAQSVLSSVSESEREDFNMVNTALRQRFSPPHREKAFRSMFQQRIA